MYKLKTLKNDQNYITTKSSLITKILFEIARFIIILIKNFYIFN